MGLHVNVYKSGDYDCTAGGESSYVKGFTVVNCDGPFEPSEDYPAAVIVKQKFGFGCSLKLVPESKVDHGGTMFGGNYASTSDSRFGQACRDLIGDKDLGNMYGLGAIPIHDRVEW